MRNTIVIAVISLAIAGCGKSKFESTPKLQYKSVNTTELRSGQIIEFKLGYTDAEGDLQDTLYVEKVEPTCPASGFHENYQLPSFPTVKDSEGDIIVSYGYNVSNYPLILGPQCSRNDTCYFRFAVSDKAKHKSDTVISEPIVLVYE